MEGLGKFSPTNVTKFLSGIDYPADRAKILEQARKNNAPQNVLDVLNKIPDQVYTNMADLMHSVGLIK